MSQPHGAGPLKRALMRVVVPEVALALIRSLDASWRYRETDRHHLLAALDSGRPVIGAFLHGRIFLLLRFMSRRRNGRWLSMCSQSLDGDAMARVEQRLGFEVVRGSSGSGGLQALVDMIERVHSSPGLGACLAVDGSRGPRGRVQGGIVALAQRTGGLILPVTASARPAHIFRRAWDRTLLPLPFARVEVIYGEPFAVPARMKAAELKRWCTELESRMVALQARADQLSGSADEAGVCAPVASD